MFALGRSGRPYRSSPLCKLLVRMSDPSCERGSWRLQVVGRTSCVNQARSETHTNTRNTRNIATQATHRSLAHGVMPTQGAHVGHVLLQRDTRGEVLQGDGGTGGPKDEIWPRAANEQFVAPGPEKEGKTAWRELRLLSRDWRDSCSVSLMRLPGNFIKKSHLLLEKGPIGHQLSSCGLSRQGGERRGRARSGHRAKHEEVRRAGKSTVDSSVERKLHTLR